MADVSDETTRLLVELNEGHRSAADRLLPLVYDELRALAAAYFRNERSDHTLQPTALVHEAYVRLVGQANANWESRAHFFAVAAKAMRNTRVNHALARKTVKRGGGMSSVVFDVDASPSPANQVDTLELDDALKRLAVLDQRKAEVVELRFFGGMTVEETAHVLGASISTVEADWRTARAWLSSELSDN